MLVPLLLSIYSLLPGKIPAILVRPDVKCLKGQNGDSAVRRAVIHTVEMAMILLPRI